jgi:hypothetical protein
MTDASPPLRMVAVSLDCADPGELPFCVTTVVPPGVTPDEPAAAGS